jgi:hypothetical protein
MATKKRLIRSLRKPNRRRRGRRLLSALASRCTRGSLTRSPARADIYLDQDFRNEIDRRNRIMTGESLTAYTEKENIASPRPFFPN